MLNKVEHAKSFITLGPDLFWFLSGSTRKKRVFLDDIANAFNKLPSEIRDLIPGKCLVISCSVISRDLILSELVLMSLKQGM